MKKEDKVFNNIYNTITKFDCGLELKELLYQSLMNNDDYYPPTYLSVINSKIKNKKKILIVCNSTNSFDQTSVLY